MVKACKFCVQFQHLSHVYLNKIVQKLAEKMNKSIRHKWNYSNIHKKWKKYPLLPSFRVIELYIECFELLFYLIWLVNCK